jgi:hypothetical protein
MCFSGLALWRYKDGFRKPATTDRANSKAPLAWPREQSEIWPSKNSKKNSHTVPVWFHSETIRDPAVELKRPRWLMLLELGAARFNADLERELVRARLLILTTKAAKPPHLSDHRDTGGS